MVSQQVLDKIEVPTHSSIRIKGEQVVYVDPFQIEGTPQDADVILVTHDHYDHFSLEDIRKIINRNTVLVAPEGMQKQSEKTGLPKEQILSVLPGAQLIVKDIPIETVPAYNRHKVFHPKRKNWLGYILTIEGTRCYIAGDTDRTPESQNVVCDIALVPIGGTYTMNATEAAALVNEIKPQVAIPIHYGNIVGTKKDADVFKAAVDENIRIVIAIS